MKTLIILGISYDFNSDMQIELAVREFVRLRNLPKDGIVYVLENKDKTAYRGPDSSDIVVTETKYSYSNSGNTLTKIN